MNNELKTVDSQEIVKDLALLNDELKDSTLIETLNKIESISREMSVGGMTTFQRKEFVLNPTDYPPGTVEKSRQAIFEASVRVSGIKGSVFDFHKTTGEIDKAKARLMRAQSNLKKLQEMPLTDEVAADLLEAQGEERIARYDLLAKEESLAGLKARSAHQLQEVKDFYEEFQKNEVYTAAKGMSYKDWNTEKASLDYWGSVQDARIQKAMSYGAAGISQQQGDSLPFQNRPAILLKQAQELQKLAAAQEEQLKLENKGENVVSITDAKKKLSEAFDETPSK